MPIASLARSFHDLYGVYFDVVSNYSPSDRQKLFHGAATIYGV